MQCSRWTFRTQQLAVLSFFTVLSFGLCTGCKGGGEGLTASDGSEAAWVHYAEPDGTYSVDLPGKPIPVDRDEPSGMGHYTMHFLGARLESGDFEVGHADVERYIKDQGAEAAYTAIRDLIGRSFGTKNIVVSKVTCSGITGNEYTMDLPEPAFPAGSVGDFRVFVLKGRVYEQIAVGSPKLVKGSVRERFFSSLQLNDKSPTSATPPTNK